MQFDIIIPTRWVIVNIYNILQSIQKQTVLPEYIILVVNESLLHQDVDEWGKQIKNITPLILLDKIKFVTICHANASLARNMWIARSVSTFVYMIDDDNVFWHDFLENSVREYEYYEKYYKKSVVYSPAIQRRTTNKIQSLWMKTFHYILGRPEPVIFGWRKNIFVAALRFFLPLSFFYKEHSNHCRVSAIWWNSILWPREIFLDNAFDENMPFVYEDIDAMYRISQKNTPIIVSKKNKICHMERNKNKLEHSFLADIWWAYQKWKNRNIFVKKNWNKIQKILFFVVGWPITSLFVIVFLLLYGKNIRRQLIKAYLLWYFHWLTHKI